MLEDGIGADKMRWSEWSYRSLWKRNKLGATNPRLPDLQAITSHQQDLCQKWIGLALFVPLSGRAYPQIDVDLAAP